MPEPGKKRGLAFRLSLFILSSTTLIFLVAFGYNYIYSRKLVLKNVEEDARLLTQATVNKIEIALRSVEKSPRYMASALEHFRYDRKGLERDIRNMLEANRDIFGSAVAFEPYAFNASLLYCAPYLFWENNVIKRTSLGSKSYRYFYWDWYQIPKELDRAIWSEPYYDEGGGGIVMSTYSMPFYRTVRDERIFSGIVTADISLVWLLDIIAEISIFKTGYAFLISQNGVFLTHPDKKLVMQESIFSLAEERRDPNLREVGRKMIRGGSGFVPVQSYFAGRKAWMYYAPLPSTGWSMGVIIPENELFADIRALNGIVVSIVFAGFVVLLLVSISISRRIAGPIRDLALKANDISRGNLDVMLPKVDTHDEVEELASSFDHMRLALKEYIFNLQETTAAKERIESELKIARTIQMSFLPKRFPPFPEKPEFEIFASLQPAKEVGGDLYDFFLLDDRHLFFSIGDVSGKGVPAALFMAVTITLMKGISQQKIDPSEILARVNRELCQENESMMFVTVFCGILDMATGELSYSNAGHNPPVLCSGKTGPGWLPLPEGPFLGIMEEATYRTASLFLKPGDLLILYTDGVTEAMNPDQKLYSDERLILTMESNCQNAPEEVVRDIMASVKAFAGAEPQSDDVALLALRFLGSRADD